MLLSKFHILEKFIANTLIAKPRITVWLQICENKYNTQPSPMIKIKTKPPFAQFLSENYQIIREKNPNLPMLQLSKKLGQMWRALSVDEKDRYRLKYQELKKANDDEMKLQFKKMTETEKQEYLAEQSKLKERIRLKRIKMLQKKFNKPKKIGVNPYGLFVKSKFLERGDAPFLQYSKGLQDYWVKMTEEDKEPFVTEARQNAIKYKRLLAEWERQMLASGHKSLISKSRLNTLLKKPYIAKRPKRKITSIAAKKNVQKIKTNSTLQKLDKKVVKKVENSTVQTDLKEDQLLKVLKILEETIKKESKVSTTPRDKPQKSIKKN